MSDYLNKRMCMYVCVYVCMYVCLFVCMNHSWRIHDVISTFQVVAPLTKMFYYVSMAASVKSCDTVISKLVFRHPIG